MKAVLSPTSSTRTVRSTRSTKRNPGPRPRRNGLAWSLANAREEELRNPEEAVELARRAVELAPEQDGHWGTLGLACYRTEQWQDCLDALERSLELKGGEGAEDGYNGLIAAMAHERLGELEEARERFDRAAAWIEAGGRPSTKFEAAKKGVIGMTITQPPDEDEELMRLHAEAAALLGIEEDQ